MSVMVCSLSTKQSKIYWCPICGKSFEISNNVTEEIHHHFVRHLVKFFLHRGFIIIEEGKIPKEEIAEGWRSPDIFVLDKNLRLIKIIEVIVSNPFMGTTSRGDSILDKCRKIHNAYCSGINQPPEIIIFIPIKLINLVYDVEYEARKLGKVRADESLQELYERRLKSEGIDVKVWTPEDLKELEEK